MDITPKYRIPSAEQEVVIPEPLFDIEGGTSRKSDAQELPQRLTVANKRIIVSPGDDLQKAIDTVSAAGGGNVVLNPGTFLPTADITIPSDVALTAVGVGTIIDFGGGAYQIKIVGSNSYTTGTVAVSNDGTTVTGTGTTFTAAMEGRSILLEDFWYEIEEVVSTTSLTLASAYVGNDLSGASCVIATPVANVLLEGFTVQNSTVALIKAQYFDFVSFAGLSTYDGLAGYDLDDGSSPLVEDFDIDGCTDGVQVNNCPLPTFENVVITNCSGAAFAATKLSNATIFSVSVINCASGFQFTTCSDFSLLSFSIKQITGKGIEFISGNSDAALSAGSIRYCGSDAIKLTATSDSINIYDNYITDNTGYGVNLAAATCDNNIIHGNQFTNNTAGSVNDSGTTTKIRDNIGVADN